MEEINPQVGFGRFGKNGRLGYGNGIPGESDSPVEVAGRRFVKALSMVPPSNGVASVQYQLAKQFKTFRAWVAVSDLD